MRNPLARLAKRDPAKPSLKQRFAATREKYARTLRVHRALNKPLPMPEPVDRVALVNYASWLFMERRLVCAELYPRAGVKAASFVISAGAAERFHFPRNVPSDASAEALKASARAVKVLDMMGVDWRADLPDRANIDPPEFEGYGDTPKLPHGWPRLDAALLEALDDLNRLDAAIDAIPSTLDRDLDEMPEFGPLSDARDVAISALIHTRADGLLGLQAKAKALLADNLADGDGKEVAKSLARDLIGAAQTVIKPRPDPIFAVIEECRRLADERDATFNEWPHATSEPADLIERRNGLTDSLFACWHGAVLKTVPTTARGCAALAEFAASFISEQAVDDDNALSALRLIARSPLL